MKKITRTHISLETKEVLVIRSAGRSARTWCPKCGALTQMAPPEEAASVGAVATHSSYGWIAAGRVHGFPLAETLFACLNSILSKLGHNSKQ
jgi:hypothetical protein